MLSTCLRTSRQSGFSVRSRAVVMTSKMQWRMLTSLVSLFATGGVADTLYELTFAKLSVVFMIVFFKLRFGYRGCLIVIQLSYSVYSTCRLVKKIAGH